MYKVLSMPTETILAREIDSDTIAQELGFVFSDRATQLQPSKTLGVLSKVKQMQAAGKWVAKLCVGELDSPTPTYIKAAAIEAIRTDQTRYTQVPGTLGVRTAICEKFARDNGLEFTPDEIVVSPGAKASLYFAMLAIVDPGDKVMIPKPCWVSYGPQLELMGGISQKVESDENFIFTADILRENLTDKTTLLILTDPSNPTGKVMDRATKQELANEIATINKDRLERGIKPLMVIADEIYEKLTYGSSDFVSIGKLMPEGYKHFVVTVNGVSKGQAMTGWRVGFLGAAAPLAKKITNIQGHITSNVNTPSQFAVEEALTDKNSAHLDELTSAMVRELEERGQYVYEGLNSIDGIEVVEPEGAFYLFPNISALLGKQVNGEGPMIETDEQFCIRLLEETGVALVPGSAFDAPGYARVSFAVDRQTLQEAMARLVVFANSLS
jgi:aspartate aminotransferase